MNASTLYIMHLIVDKIVLIGLSFACGISGWSDLDNVCEPWVWWTELYREPSKKNLGLEKNVCREGNFFSCHFVTPKELDP